MPFIFKLFIIDMKVIDELSRPHFEVNNAKETWKCNCS